MIMAGLLRENNIDVEIIHLDLEIDTRVEAILDFNRLDAVGMDCHWVNQGLAVINLAKAIKRIKPGVFIFLGGYTASFFAREVLENYSFIDAVIRGDGEVPILELCKALCRRPSVSLEHVRNLAWREGNNKIVFNPFSYAAGSREMDLFDFAGMDLLRNREFYLDFSRYWTGFSPLDRRPLFLLEIGRGCRYNCVYCGGNARAQEYISGRRDLAVRSVDAVTATVKKAVSFGYKLFLASFEFEGSDRWYIDLFRRIKEERLDIDFAYESWGIPSNLLIDELSRCFDRAIITISPDSGDNRLRKKSMDNRLFYTNSRLEECLDYIGGKNNLKVQLYFGYFLPGDTEETVYSTMDYLSKLFFKYSYFAEIIYMNFNTDPCSSLFLDPGKYNLDISVGNFSDFIMKLEENYIGKNGAKPGLTLLSRPAAVSEAHAVNLANKANLFNRLFCLRGSILQLFEKTGKTTILSGYLRGLDLSAAGKSDFTVERFKEVLIDIAGKYIPAPGEIIDVINREYEDLPLKGHLNSSTNFYIPGSKRTGLGMTAEDKRNTIRSRIRMAREGIEVDFNLDL
jgi:radical SAM superfamily enzyme YgiQ (UPF0313 family)